MEKDEKYLVELRDCFTGGYTLPQYCIDEKISKPLFVSEEKFLQFMWEVYVQFCYDKRMLAQFSFLNVASGKINISTNCVLGDMEYKNISEVNLAEFDAIISLTSKKFFLGGRVIYLDELTAYFIRKTYCEIPLLHFLQRNPKVHVLVTNFPMIDEPLTNREKQLCSRTIQELYAMISSSKEPVATPYDFLGYTNQEVHELLEMADAKVNSDGTTSLKNCEGSLIGILDGKRITVAAPKNFRNTIYFMGTCTFFGIGAPFDKTIESYLQKMLNENNLPYRVENESQFFANRYQDIFYNLNNLPTRPGDIVFLCMQNLFPFTIPSIDIRNIFDGFTGRDKIFCDSSHVNELGYKILAEKFFDFLTTNNFFRDKDFKNRCS